MLIYFAIFQFWKFLSTKYLKNSGHWSHNNNSRHFLKIELCIQTHIVILIFQLKFWRFLRYLKFYTGKLEDMSIFRLQLNCAHIYIHFPQRTDHFGGGGGEVSTYGMDSCSFLEETCHFWEDGPVEILFIPAPYHPHRLPARSRLATREKWIFFQGT